MTMTITLGWWLIPLALTIAAMWWCASQDYNGDYNFNAVVTLPITGFVICFVWMIYFAAGWALA